MKYIKAKVQEIENLNTILSIVNYIGYNKELRAAEIYIMDDMDIVYYPIEERYYENFLDKFIEKDVIVLDKVCFTRPFNDLLDGANKKNIEKYNLIHEDIRKRAEIANSKK